MGLLFEELDYRPTPMGALSLRRRKDPVLGRIVHEIRLDEEYLMSSLFTEAEERLARLGLAALEGEGLAIAVGGLGLGYTARAVLEHDEIGSLLVADALPEVIEWHEAGLRRLTEHLRPGGVFALWSDDPPDEEFETALAEAFAETKTRLVTFPNLHENAEVSNTVYVAVKAGVSP